MTRKSLCCPGFRCVFAGLLLIAGLTSRGAPGSAGVFNVLDLGAKGDGTSNDTVAVQKAVDACAANGGGQVLLPGGKTFLTGTLTLRSAVDFHLASGAVLKGSSNWRDYLPAGALLFAKDATNVIVSGDGAIDGNDAAVWQKLADELAGGDINKPNWWPESFVGDWWPFGKALGTLDSKPGRPLMVIFIGCQQVKFRDVTLRAAPSWTVHLIGCEDVSIQSISLLNSWDVPNNDGIDLDHCRDVRVANCLIRCADDGIVVKNTPNFAAYGDSERITVTGCVIESRSAALKIDEIYTGAARDVVFADCVIRRSNRGLCIQTRDIGDIENVLFANITVETRYWTGKWWGAGEPIHVSHVPRNPGTKLGLVRNIRFNNILCRGENGIFIHGDSSRPIEGLQLDNVRVELTKTGDETGGFYDLRPQGGVFNGVFTNKLAGIYARHLSGLTVRDSKVVWGKLPGNYFGDALDQADVAGLELDHFTGGPAPEMKK